MKRIGWRVRSVGRPRVDRNAANLGFIHAYSMDPHSTLIRKIEQHQADVVELMCADELEAKMLDLEFMIVSGCRAGPLDLQGDMARHSVEGLDPDWAAFDTEDWE